MASITTGWRDVISKDVGNAPGILGTKPYPLNVFYVDSVTANTNASVDGKSWANAFSTLTYALTKCTASRGDVIYLSPRHAETITAAAGVDVNIAGVSIIGMGNGTNRPTFGIGTATTATFKISAANVYLSNVRMRAVTAQLLVKMLDVAEGDFTCEDCWFQGASTSTFLVQNFVHLNTTFDNFVFRRCQFFQGTDPAAANAAANTGVFYIVDSENVLLEDIEAFGFFETAIVHNKTTKVQNLWVVRPRWYVALSDAQPYLLVAAASGGSVDGGIITPAETAVTEATLVGTIGDVFFLFGGSRFGNDGAAGGQGGIIPATAS